jgi:hypothetical protein
MREVAERPEPVIERHEDDALLGEGHAVARVADARALGQRAAMNPHEYGTFLAGGGRRPDVEEQAVLALWLQRPDVDRTGGVLRLWTLRAVLRRVADAGP